MISIDKSKLTVIICHGFSSSKEGSAKDIAEALKEKGINSFRFDFYGHGESDGEFEKVTVSEGVDNIINAYKYLREEGFERIGLLGTSFGGACSIQAAAQLPELAFLALRSPVTDYLDKELMTKTKSELEEWKSNGFRIYKNGKGEERKLFYSFFEDMYKNRGFTAGTNIKVDTFVVHGDKDDRVPLILSEMFVKVVPNAVLEIVSGADHIYSDPELDKLAISILVNWMCKYA